MTQHSTATSEPAHEAVRASPVTRHPAYATPPDAPVRFEVPHHEIYDRRAILARWLLVIPHVGALLVLEVLATCVWLWAAASITVRGRYPRSARNFVTGVGRWWLRVAAYTLSLTEAYPPFSLTDDPYYPVRFDVLEPTGDTLARWRPLVGWCAVVPQIAIVVFLYVGLMFVELISSVSILRTGTFPRELFDTVLRTLRFHARVGAYAYCLTDVYPGFVV